MNKKSFIALSLIFTHCVNVNAATRLEVDFDHTPLGHYQSKTVEKDWPNLQWQSLLGRAQIVSSTDNEHKKVLKVDFPKGAVGPQEGGGQFLMSLPATEELWLSYHVKFAHNFDFRLGGKLPGLSSGGSKYTGGHIPTKGEGWSARYMWRQNGEGIIYLYYMDMPW
ncbi:hypothetical protein RS130_15275 [Paraglaciecola aquimarina]|uniref:Polysaccharide lyase 14 domain-containing protein n=1 Tax=Paraglaciecola aquimarina TaxID=1235557 RepID=A0ABU3SYJ0_9ALTE|nr:hypothetical protein [Paraglaciecola aquimarina]MDU0355079.1 hypothetical protein [Paraglaciecola aquimarina]